ncbi:MAG: ergothioneine biosynthesis protein EgtB [Deltaproteobacteria bacterium]|nr:ergothioneine biosynthesis protein EgtB [Deltaproteobacteria bacterium]
MDRSSWIQRYVATRAETERLAAPLSDEDRMVQAMADASPTKWHLAHTTWFFENFLVLATGGEAFHPSYGYLFNSYYEAVGPRHARPARGLLSRPSTVEIAAYRTAVDARMVDLLERSDGETRAGLAPLVRLGVAHEEQHQELILTDILAAFAANVLEPVYVAAPEIVDPTADEVSGDGCEPARFVSFEGGLVTLGARDDLPFAFDNERPAHRVFLEPYAVAERPITLGEAAAFAREGGYRTPSLWLSEGWDWAQHTSATAPGYTRFDDGVASVLTLHGRRVPSPRTPAAHLSYYEADAIARWLGARLPTEAEWEHAACSAPLTGHFRDEGWLTPRPQQPSGSADATVPRLQGLFGDVWEWTSSAYGPYPGFAPARGAIGEYNGKFMVGQMVLRGGSCLSNRAHLRASYRNFWPPHTRFQMTGARLARDAR